MGTCKTEVFVKEIGVPIFIKQEDEAEVIVSTVELAKTQVVTEAQVNVRIVLQGKETAYWEGSKAVPNCAFTDKPEVVENVADNKVTCVTGIEVEGLTVGWPEG